MDTLGNIIFSMRSPFVLSTSFSKIKLINQQSHGANEELQGRRGKRKRSDTNTLIYIHYTNFLLKKKQKTYLINACVTFS